MSMSRSLGALLVLACFSIPALAFEGGLKGECGDDDPGVGGEAELSSLSHGVSGMARVIDNCTILIEDFNYDGEGINVRVYGFENISFDGGVELSDDLIRDEPYENEMLTVTIPEGVSLDDVAVISIWCVPAGVSFGHGVFEGPDGPGGGGDSGCDAGSAGGSVNGVDFVVVLLAAALLGFRRVRAWRSC